LQRAAATPGEPLPVWQPDASLVGRLGPSKDVVTIAERYELRPPKAYQQFAPPPPPPSSLMHAWKGESRRDGSTPMIIVMVVTPPPDAKQSNLEDFLDGLLKGVERQRTDWSRTPGAYGKVNGFTMLRARWSGTEPKHNWKMHGFQYVAMSGPNYIQISSQDVEPNHEEALKLAEASALTFKKQ
jgi:hypothetical protein